MEIDWTSMPSDKRVPLFRAAYRLSDKQIKMEFVCALPVLATSTAPTRRTPTGAHPGGVVREAEPF